MKRTLLFVVVILAVVACTKLKETPVVDYVMEEYKLESIPGCVSSDTTGCASFEVQYPEFLGIDTTVRASIASKVNFLLNGSVGAPRSLETMGQEFIADYGQFLKEMPGYGLGWYFRGKVHVMISSDTLISLQVDTESFTGGAHASFTTNFVNVDPKTGTAYLLDAFLKPGYQEDLTRLAEEDLRNQIDVANVDSVMEMEFPDGKFALNDNYGFRKEGVVFYFNDYEIASYAEGPTEILIPYEKLIGWMK